MSREKQIEEIKALNLLLEDARVDMVLLNSDGDETGAFKVQAVRDDATNQLANILYKAGYRKQSEGEWVDTGDFELDNIYSGWKCSLCGHIFCGNKTNYCSNCGAKMGGGE